MSFASPRFVALSLVLVGGAAVTCSASGDASTSSGADTSASTGASSSMSSSTGTAECKPGEVMCSQACVTLDTASDCGACGRACPSGESCCNGVACATDASCSGLTLTSISISSGLIDGGAYATLKGTGFAKGLRAYVGDGLAPARVVDDQTATIVTPPTTAGTYDVEVTLAGAKATLPAAFDVTSATFDAAWIEVDMSSPRGNFPGITTLQDGRVLVEGGSSTSDPATSLATAELFDPTTKTMSLTLGSMSILRNTTSAITLLDGRALILGACNQETGDGCFVSGDRAIAELFDPTTSTFTTTATPLVDTTRVYFSPVLLADGRVLITSASMSGKEEIFDPDTDSFTEIDVSPGGIPTRLRDGRVLFVSTGLEVLDPDTLALTPIAGTLDHAPAAVFTLPDGRVGCVGGTIATNDGMVTPTDALVVIDVAQQTATTLAAKLSAPRIKFASALIGSGAVLVGGGVTMPYPITYGCQSDTFPTTANVDAVDFTTTTDTTFPTLNDSKMELVATTLLGGSILVAGGAACGGGVAYPHVYFLEGTAVPK